MDQKESPLEKAFEIGSKAVDGAKDLFEKAKPIIEEGAQKAVEGVKDVYGKVRPKVEEGAQKAAESVKGALDHLSGKKEQDDTAKEVPLAGAEILDESEEAVSEAPVEGNEEQADRPLDVHEEIAAHVDEQVAQIRAAQYSTDVIHAYFERKLEEPDTTNE